MHKISTRMVCVNGKQSFEYLFIFLVILKGSYHTKSNHIEQHNPDPWKMKKKIERKKEKEKGLKQLESLSQTIRG